MKIKHTATCLSRACAAAAFFAFAQTGGARMESFTPAASYPETSVTLRTSDAGLQIIFDASEKKARDQLQPLSPGLIVLKEAGGYAGNIWLENGPLMGEVYARRNIGVALNNQLVFMMTQRKDGRLPGMIRPLETVLAASLDKPDHRPPGIEIDLSKVLFPDYRFLQGFFFANNAYTMYFWINKDKAYLADLYKTLESFDDYLWRVRDSNDNGVLESWCAWDTGEDTGIRYMGATNTWPFDYPPNDKGAWVWATTFERVAEPEQMMLKDPETFDKDAYDKLFKKKIYSGNPCPVESMDFMGFSHDARATLAKISRELGNGREAHWNEKAAQVRDTLAAHLWRPEKHAFYDRDQYGEFMDTLLHNNLRVMHFGACTQQAADEFIRHHLLNPAEFWTPMPLPSIAANDPMFRNVPGNNWSGQPTDLTWQRAIRALENYNHLAEVTLLGRRLIDNLYGKSEYYQQFDPFTGENNGPVAKGDRVPLSLALLEYISRLYGVHLDLENRRILWSGLSRDGHSITYAQRFGDNTYRIDNKDGNFEAALNGKKLFSCTADVRVVTDLDGNIVHVAGIDSVPRRITLKTASVSCEATVRPNETHALDKGALGKTASIPFDYPYKQSKK